MAQELEGQTTGSFTATSPSVTPGTLNSAPATGANGMTSEFSANIYGAALFGNLFLTWIARKAEDCIARRATIWHLFIYKGHNYEENY